MDIHYKKFAKAAIIVVLSLITINAHAVKLIGEIGAHIGGETLVNGQDSVNGWYSVDAGSLLSLGIGAQFDLQDDFHIRTLVGWKSDSVDLANEISNDSLSKSISFTRFPVEVMFFYQTLNWNFGAGITYHTYTELSGNGAPHKHYENSLGYSAEVDLRIGEFAYLGAKFTAIDYNEENSTTTISGNSIGIVFGLIIDTNNKNASFEY